MRLVKQEVKILLVYHECIFFLKKNFKKSFIIDFYFVFQTEIKSVGSTILQYFFKYR